MGWPELIAARLPSRAALPIAGLVVNTLAQCILGRLPLAIGPVRRQFVSFSLGLVAVLALAAVDLARDHVGALDAAGALLLALGTYACLGFCLFNLINANVSSLRVRMLREYLRLDPAALADTELGVGYGAEQILDSRLGRLIAGGQIERQGDRYRARPGLVLVIAGFFAGLRRLLLRD